MQALHDTCTDHVGNRRISSRHGASAVTVGPNRHLGVCEIPVEKPFYMQCFDRLASIDQAFVQPVQAPHVCWMLARTGERVIKSQIGAMDRLGLVVAPCIEQQRVGSKVPKVGFNPLVG